jgi:hypothetical protein
MASLSNDILDIDLDVALTANPIIDILTGQSNAVSGYCTSANLPAEYAGIKSDRYVLDLTRNDIAKSNATFNSLGIDLIVDNYSEEQSFLKGGVAFNSTPKVIIKNALGSQAIVRWATTGIMYKTLTDNIDAALAYCTRNGLTPTFRSLLWMQGESDCLNGTLAAYEAALTAFINNIRGYNAALAGLKIVLCKLDTDMTGLVAADIGTINGIFDSVAGALANVVILNPNDYVLTMANNLHYSAASVLTLGEKWSDLINV